MNKLKIAIQKKGRLSDKSIALLQECGIRISNGQNKLTTSASNFPFEVLFLRDDDIPQYVEEGVADIGILGENVLLEKAKQVDIKLRLGFGKCRLSIAVPKGDTYSDTSFFQNRKIATSYPRILGNFLAEQNVEASIEELGGSVEIAPGIGLADGVCDIVSTGSTLLQNGLVEVETVLLSEAILVSGKSLDNEKQAVLDKLIFRIKAVLESRANKYILMNAPNDAIEAISKILPGMKCPTVIPLSNPGWSSVQSVVKEDEFWEVIDELSALGAQGILVMPIEKMIL